MYFPVKPLVLTLKTRVLVNFQVGMLSTLSASQMRMGRRGRGHNTIRQQLHLDRSAKLEDI